MHMRRWGAVYLLIALFIGSWVGQFVAQAVEGDGWILFASATFENWQSEFLQLAVQTLVVVGLADRLFKASKDDTARIEKKIDKLLDSSLRKTE
jgi:alpha/beta superfamily hydrolase